MTKIMPSLQNLIKLSYDAPAFAGFFVSDKNQSQQYGGTLRPQLQLLL